MNKKLSKKTMTRYQIRNTLLNKRSDLGRKAWNKQRNNVVNLSKKKKKKNFTATLTLTFRHSTFCETVEPFVSR